MKGGISDKTREKGKRGTRRASMAGHIGTYEMV